jgi:hypothetical protein
MMDGKKYVVDLLGDRFDVHSTTGTDTGVPGAFDPIADQAELDARAKQLDALKARFANDPQAVLDDFREFFHDPQLTVDEVKQYLDTWTFAVTDPQAFADAIDTGQPSYGLGDWFNRVRAYLHAPKDVSSGDAKLLDELRQRYEFPNDIAINPNVRQFETYDPAWVPLLNAKLAEERGTWPDLQPFRRHESFASRFVYPSTLPYGSDGIRIGLMADFGTGYYHSLAIARQLAAHAYPYVFHLGDVYYAGRPDEFKNRFTVPLANVVKRSKFFGLPENHELYSGGKSYLAYIDDLRKAHPHQQQEGSYFCVPFEHHQLIAIDVNWNGRQHFLDPKCRDWLVEVLTAGKGKTNILLTGSAPYDYPSKDRRKLLADLWPYVRNGQIHLWFWGDDHYTALFSRDATLAPFIGSCIGHAGYPGPKMEADRECWAKPLWVEDEPRFPAWTKLRQDVNNNGWCEATLMPDGSVELLYVDWLAAKRHHVVLQRMGEILQPTTVGSFGGRGDRTTVPTLHRPG